MATLNPVGGITTPGPKPERTYTASEVAELRAERDGYLKQLQEDPLAREVAELKAEKDGAYKERDALVSALSNIFPSSLERHPDEDISWENDWRWIVFIDLPTGQATWHIHDSELSMFDHLKRFQGRVWDGHSTPEKYERLAALRAEVDKQP